MEETGASAESALDRLKRLEELTGHRFARPELLLRAVTHRSWTNEQEDERLGHNESLEFLGDSVLGFLVASMIYRRFPDLTEGELSKIKSFLVSAANLLRLAERMGLGDFLRLSRGEDKTGGRRKKAILVDAYEAVIGALYLDGGPDVAGWYVEGQLAEFVDALDVRQLTYGDFKSALQERLHGLGLPEAEYRVVGEIGPDHRKVFVIQIWIGDRQLSEGTGRTKKEAQQEAARLALDSLETPPTADPGSP
jgi:ribonuclease III